MLVPEVYGEDEEGAVDFTAVGHHVNVARLGQHSWRLRADDWRLDLLDGDFFSGVIVFHD